ncbi:histidine kinase [Sorangium cellulosum]|uniref:histidine kinase n=1 Tax=Sorangium cellulosum TaxID=56 RepID=A0A2L0F3Y1_SORCE|nr:ATP-binding protein [Sorangium cellulosum]AUX46288.1 histidine kinase [Sorangium cellulosum]
MQMHGGREQRVDLTNCAVEPIHIPGRIQPHGALLVLSPRDLAVRHVSRNVGALLGRGPEELLESPLLRVLRPAEGVDIESVLRSPDPAALNPLKVGAARAGATAWFDAIAHRAGEQLIVEVEPVASSGGVSFSDVYRAVHAAIERIQGAAGLAEACEATAEEVKRLTGYDRVMIYRFDREWNGEVIAEAREADIEPYLGLRYPASDIPPQARELYTRNWLRIIPDVAYQPADIVPEPSRPIDLSFSVLRSVSPMHIQYLKNMGVGASMSVSLLRDGVLWGLIACHHRTARPLSYEIRQACELCGRFLSLQLVAKEKLEDRDRVQELRSLTAQIVATVSRHEDLVTGLTESAADLMKLADASGGAVCHGDVARPLGLAPAPEELRGLHTWLRRNVADQPVFHADSLSKLDPAFARIKDVASGILCISIPEPDPWYVVWLRPEVIQTVRWSGNPEKPVESSAEGAVLGPRRSFALWKQTVELTAVAFRPAEVEAAEELRRALIDLDLSRQVVRERNARAAAEESNAELEQFGYIVAHDLKEPLRGIKSLAGFVIEDDRAALSAESQGNLQRISDLSASTMGLINSLYEYSRLGKVDFSFGQVDLNQVLADVTLRLSGSLRARGAEVHVPRPLPTVFCDRVRIGEVLANLITNGVKYNTSDAPWVEVGFDETSIPMVFYVRDNGVGIPEGERHRLFKMFERLSYAEHHGEGTGSGLAITQRIVGRHKGKIWAESHSSGGTIFYFTLAEAPLTDP